MKKHHPRDVGDQLLEELEALRAELRRHAGHTRQISTGPGEARDVLERVARVDDERCRLHGSGDDPPRPRAHGEQNVDRNLHEVGGQSRHPVVSAICESLLDDEVLPLDVAFVPPAEPGKDRNGGAEDRGRRPPASRRARSRQPFALARSVWRAGLRRAQEPSPRSATPVPFVVMA